MPDHAIREMTADWVAASMTYNGYLPTNSKEWPWMENNLESVVDKLSTNSAELLATALLELGFVKYASIALTHKHRKGDV